MEKTGSDTQYYEKFFYRMQLSKALSMLYDDSAYNSKFIEFYAKEPEVFERFVNFLLNEINENFF